MSIIKEEKYTITSIGNLEIIYSSEHSDTIYLQVDEELDYKKLTDIIDVLKELSIKINK